MYIFLFFFKVKTLYFSSIIDTHFSLCIKRKKEEVYINSLNFFTYIF